MIEPKPGYKTSEILALVAGLLCAVLPVVLDKVPPGSVWVAVLGAVLAAATYIAGRSHVKAATVKAAAIREVAAAENPTEPE